MLLVLSGVLLLIEYSVGANILFISSVTSPSHYLWNKVLSLELVKNGHNLTMLNHEVENRQYPNFTVITMDGIYKVKREKLYSKNFATDTNIFKSNYFFFSFYDLACEHDINTSGFKTLLNYPRNFTFDLIIFDITLPVCLYGFIPRFNNPPVVAVSPMSLASQLYYAFGNPLFTSFMPYVNSEFTNEMTFKQRLLNCIYFCAEFINYRVISLWNQDKTAKRGFGESLPSLRDIELNISLFLLNTDPIFDYPIPLLPNVIPVGGLQIRPPKALPKDLEEIIDNYNGDIIYFSLGTNIKINDLKQQQVDAITKTFSNLKQLVLWKHVGENIAGVSKNVVLRKWFPQNDLLAHPKMKLFITHCGALGSQEAMARGVPMVAIPFNLDQKSNAAKLERKRISVTLDSQNFTYDSFHSAVEEVLTNPIYRRNVKFISERYNNQPQTALERAVFWIEHVLRYGSVDYLNSPMRTLPLYKLLNIDVALLLIFSVFSLFYIIKLITFSFICCTIKPKSKKKIS